MPGYDRIALVLQGGGALGAYQVGVFEALDAAGYCPHWFCGTSIGGINAAIMAGNEPAARLPKLTEFWETISRPDGWGAGGLDDEARKLANQWHSFEAVTLGQPGFFRPRSVNPWLAPAASPDAISFYDTGPLAATLTTAVDLDRLNDGGTRLSLGAVNVLSGQQVYFDSARQAIGYEHIMASGALPPGFPPIFVDGEPYWDGGIVSNTPLDTVLDDEPRVSTLCFMVDLFDAAGPVPQHMDEVLEREKDIRYASRAQRNIASYRRIHNLRRAVTAMWNRLPPAVRAEPTLQELAWMGCTTTMQIVHLIYQNTKYETASKDYEFSRASIAEHRKAGRRIAQQAIAAAPWTRPVPPHVGVVVHEFANRPAAS
ncbi:MAG: DUF3734 domain-containing protein [Dongiaceae bacterium]